MPDDHSSNAGSVRPLNPATATFSTSTKVIQQTSLAISSTPAKSMATPSATQEVTVTMTAGAYAQPAWQNIERRSSYPGTPSTSQASQKVATSPAPIEIIPSASNGMEHSSSIQVQHH